MNSSVVPGFHLCNKSICEISSLLNIPRSTVSGIITKIINVLYIIVLMIVQIYLQVIYDVIYRCTIYIYHITNYIHNNTCMYFPIHNPYRDYICGNHLGPM